MIKFLDLSSQYQSLKPEIDSAIAGVLESATFIGGPEVSSFESEFAAYQSARHCIGVANATDGLEIAIEALELPAGSEIIVPANSFIASSEAVTRSGHKVVFIDPDSDTYCVTASGIAAAITERTRAIVVVHLYGQPADLRDILHLAKSKNLRIIEDAAQAHGAELDGQRVGAIGDIGVFSFYPGKNLGAYGDAGAIVTNHADLAKKARMIANHGRTAKYDHEFEGRNSRLDSIQAAILRVKLRHLDSWIERRNAVAAIYQERLAALPDLTLPSVMRDRVRHAYHLYVIRTSQRDALAAHLSGQDISTGIHYPVALPNLRAYGYLDQPSTPFTSTDHAGQLLSLPIGEHMSTAQAESVANAVRAFFEKNP